MDRLIPGTSAQSFLRTNSINRMVSNKTVNIDDLATDAKRKINRIIPSRLTKRERTTRAGNDLKVLESFRGRGNPLICVLILLLLLAAGIFFTFHQASRRVDVDKMAKTSGGDVVF